MEKNQGISVKYIYSACVVTATPDVKILHDPWFTDGAYDGSWFQYPKVKDPFSSIGNVDLVYVSHIHPDHYDPEFLKKYFEKFGKKKIIIANHQPNYLAGKIRADGFDSTILKDNLVLGKTTISIFPHKTGSISDVDSALILKYESAQRQHCVVNANDMIFDETARRDLKALAGEIDILLCGYTGAGPYPQTYFDVDDPTLIGEAEKKKNEFFDRYKTLIQYMGARVNLPFAGKYILGGKLSHLNSYRGVADAVEVTSFDSRAVILGDDGGEINTIDPVAQNVRGQKYGREMDEYAESLSAVSMKYEKLINIGEIDQLPLKKLLSQAVKNARTKSECIEDYFFCIEIKPGQYAVMNANKNATSTVELMSDKSMFPQPRSEVTIDPRYLFGLLTHVYHWNNAEVGSQFYTRRYPNVYNRKAMEFLNFLTV